MLGVGLVAKGGERGKTRSPYTEGDTQSVSKSRASGVNKKESSWCKVRECTVPIRTK